MIVKRYKDIIQGVLMKVKRVNWDVDTGITLLLCVYIMDIILWWGSLS